MDTLTMDFWPKRIHQQAKPQNSALDARKVPQALYPAPERISSILAMLRALHGQADNALSHAETPQEADLLCSTMEKVEQLYEQYSRGYYIKPLKKKL